MNARDENIAYLADLFDFNPVVIGVQTDSWLTSNGNRKVAYSFLNVLENYDVELLDYTIAKLLGLRRRKNGGLIFYPDQNPIAQLSILLGMEIKVVWK